MEKKLTAGQLLSQLRTSEIEVEDARELQERNHKQYEETLLGVLANAKKDHPNQVIYITVLSKWEKHLDIPHHYFFYRLSCPTPTYDQIVYKYDPVKDDIEFIWVVPDKITCQDYYRDRLQVPASHRELLYFVLSFMDGSLDKKCKELNGEKADSPSTIITIAE